MKRSTVILVGLAVATMGACGGTPPPPPPAPVNQDSIDAERVRLDSIRRAEEARGDSIRRAEEARRDSVRRAEEAARREAERLRNVIAERVYFDFDKSEIRAGDAEILDHKLAILRANSQLRIRIAGHADERGSDEYNLALGNRRANAAKHYLVSRGIDASRVETVSFGEERPAASGSTEEAWAQNRRDEFEITAGGDGLTAPSGE